LAYWSPVTMGAIARWGERGYIDRSALFRRVETHFDGSVRTVAQGALHSNTITLIYRRLIRTAFDNRLRVQ